MYIKVVDGLPVEYSPAQLIRDNPNVSFVAPISDEILATYNVYPVVSAAKPDADVVERGPIENINGVWTQTYIGRSFTPEEAAQREAAWVRQKKAQAQARAIEILAPKQIAAEIESLPDEDKATVAFLYDEWEAGTAYAVDDIVRYQDDPYKVIQSHTSQADWAPATAASLFTPLRDTGQGGGTPDEWVQPTGSHDAYNTGDRVTFEGAVYESLINANTYSPTAYPAGWQLIEAP